MLALVFEAIPENTVRIHLTEKNRPASIPANGKMPPQRALWGELCSKFKLERRVPTLAALCTEARFAVGVLHAANGHCSALSCFFFL
jgi:hypothetical protein